MVETPSELQPFELERTFAAPVETVWRCWTDPALFARWYKPQPNCDSEVLVHDLRPGGILRYSMKFGADMPAHYELWRFETVEAPRVLTFKQMLTDAAGEVVGNQRMPDWPKVMSTKIELVGDGDGTLQRLTWEPYDATEAELNCFAGASAYLDRGWVGGFDNLEGLLHELP